MFLTRKIFVRVCLSFVLLYSHDRIPKWRPPQNSCAIASLVSVASIFMNFLKKRNGSAGCRFTAGSFILYALNCLFKAGFSLPEELRIGFFRPSFSKCDAMLPRAVPSRPVPIVPWPFVLKPLRL